ncbi:MAG TPA: class I SAM-dependent methyltransferase [Caulobacteraceae bacterium]|nr:class I SAM-dependent methyltransferase [Caulobacteraceae bacterium]
MEDAEYQFTVDWFSHHTPVWNQLLDQHKPARIVEVGAYEGRSTCYMIERCAADHPIDVWSIDTWEGGVDNDSSVMSDVEKRFDHNVAVAQSNAVHSANVRKIKQSSNLALATLLAAEMGPTMDLVYIDGSHQAPDVLSDAVIGFSLLKVGGLMIFDDYLWYMEVDTQKNVLNMPKAGIDAFINTFMRKINIVPYAPIYQLYTQKIAP